MTQPPSYPPPPGMPPSGGFQQPPPPPPPGDVISTMIPYRNGAALASYYLGVFSLIPCLGALLGIAAIIFGIMGLKAAAKNPAAKGKVHAIVGIVLGGLFGLAWLIASAMVIISAATSR